MAQCQLTNDSLAFGTSANGLTKNHADNRIFFNAANPSQLQLSGASGNDVTLSGINAISTTGTVTAGDFVVGSDRKFKKEIESIPNAVELCKKMDGKSWTWDPTTTNLSGKAAGFIAQEIPEEIQYLVYKSERGLAIKYYAITGILVNAIKELSAQIDELKQKIEDLQESM